MAKEIRLAVVGYGMGAYHARLIKEVEGLTLYGVCDIDAGRRERAAGEHPGIQTFADYKEVLKDPKVDVVVIVTPHNLHAEMAIAAMNAGKHAITDKAMCLTVKEAEAMIAARDRNKMLLSTFHNRRWDGDFLTVRKIMAAGWLGRLYHIQSCVTGFGSIGGWRAVREQMGGWLFDWGAHTLDQILLLVASRPKTVYAFTHYRYDRPTSVEDYVNCTVTFENGVTATTVIAYINRLEMPRWYILGEKGALQGDNFEKPIRVKAVIDDLETEMSVPLLKSDWRAFYQNIADTLAGRATLAVQPEQLIPQIAIAEAAYRSVETNQVIRLNP